MSSGPGPAMASTPFTAVVPREEAASVGLELQVDVAEERVKRRLASGLQWVALLGECAVILLACFGRFPGAAGFHILGKVGTGVCVGHLVTRWLLGAHQQSQIWLIFILVPPPLLTAASLLMPSEDFISLHEGVKDAVSTTVMYFLLGAGHAAHKRSTRWKAWTAAAFCVSQLLGQLLITHVHSYASCVTFYAVYGHLPFLAGLRSGHLCIRNVSELVSGELSPVRSSLCDVGASLDEAKRMNDELESRNDELEMARHEAIQREFLQRFNGGYASEAGSDAGPPNGGSNSSDHAHHTDHSHDTTKQRGPKWVRHFEWLRVDCDDGGGGGGGSGLVGGSWLRRRWERPWRRRRAPPPSNKGAIRTQAQLVSVVGQAIAHADEASGRAQRL
jgi:hypothetical protein